MEPDQSPEKRATSVAQPDPTPSLPDGAQLNAELAKESQPAVKTPRNRLSDLVERLLENPQGGLIAALVLLSGIIYSRNSLYLSHDNIIEILRSSVYIFIIGVASTLVFVAGGLDLSVGSLFAVGNIGTAWMLIHGMPIIPAILLGGIVLGAVAGAINGVVIVYFGIPALITTLGMLFVGEGLIVIVTGGVPLYPFPDQFNAIGQSDVFGIPYLVLYAVAVGIIGHVVLEYTKFGFDVRATGGNRDAARAAGIKVNRVSVTVYILSGISATFAGMLLASQLGSGQPSVGQTTELQVISAVIIGGTSLFGGIGTIIGTALGALLLGVIQDGLVFLSLDPAYQNVVVGFIIVLAVGLDRLRRLRMWRRGQTR